jgi:hypothetical protein
MSDAMKNNYLWEAKGERDPLVARLEEALACKRYDPDTDSSLESADVGASAMGNMGNSETPATRRGVLLALPLSLAAAGLLLVSLVSFGGNASTTGDPTMDSTGGNAATAATGEAADEADDDITPLRRKRHGVKRPDENLLIGNPDRQP